MKFNELSETTRKIILAILIIVSFLLGFGIRSCKPTDNTISQEDSKSKYDTEYVHELIKELQNTFIEDYVLGSYSKYNSPASKNGLGGSKIFIDGTFEEIHSDSSVYAILTDSDGNKWSVGFGVEPEIKASYIEQYKNRKTRVFGVYQGLSGTLNIPMLMCTKFTMLDNADCHYTIEYSSFGSDLISGWETALIDFGKQNNSGNTQTDTAITDVTPTPEPTPTPTPESTYNPPTISLSEYNQLTEGMSYEKVVQIIGSGGELLSESSTSGFTTKMYSWDGEGGIGANANALFQNGSLMSKSQFGLQ